MEFLSPGQRHAFCLISISPIRKEAKDSSEMVSQLLFGEPVKVIQLIDSWVEIETIFDHYNGFVDFKHLLAISEIALNTWLNEFKFQHTAINTIETPWGNQLISCGSFIGKDSVFTIGNYSFEINSPLNEVSKYTIEDQFLNTPYLWGGKSIFGIDCSGFTQVLFRLKGINLPRDAYQQFELGQNIAFNDHQINDLVFFKNKLDKIIHVGLVIGQNKILHASGMVRMDTFDEKGIFNADLNKYTHFFTMLKRLV
jgi:hypothetical protein